MNPSSKEFKALQAKWDKKLADSGFDDAEQRDGNLKRWHSHDISRQHDPIRFEIKQEYFQAAGRFLHDHKFKSNTERRIWEYHASGLGIREIVLKIKGTGVRSRWKVHQIIQRLAKAMTKSWKE